LWSDAGCAGRHTARTERPAADPDRLPRAEPAATSAYVSAMAAEHGIAGRSRVGAAGAAVAQHSDRQPAADAHLPRAGANQRLALAVDFSRAALAASSFRRQLSPPQDLPPPRQSGMVFDQGPH